MADLRELAQLLVLNYQEYYTFKGDSISGLKGSDEVVRTDVIGC